MSYLDTSAQPIAEELVEALAAEPQAAEVFEALGYYDRQNHSEHVRTAVQEATRRRRAAAVVELLLAQVERSGTVPVELEAALAADPGAKELFDALPRRHRAEWAEHVAQAKQAATRERRAAKAVASLHAKEARVEERKAAGTHDLGKQFDRLFVAEVAPALKAAGFKRRTGPRHWIRTTVPGRTDYFEIFRINASDPDEPTFRLEPWVFVESISRELGYTEEEVAAAWPPVHLLVGPDYVVEHRLGPATDRVALAAALLRSVTMAIEAYDRADPTDLEGLIATTGLSARRAAAMVAFGQLDRARAEFAARPWHHTVDRPSDLALRLGFEPGPGDEKGGLG